MKADHSAGYPLPAGDRGSDEDLWTQSEPARSFTVRSSEFHDGAQAGRPATSGKYFYTVEIEQNGVTERSVGWLTLVRKCRDAMPKSEVRTVRHGRRCQ